MNERLATREPGSPAALIDKSRNLVHSKSSNNAPNRPAKVTGIAATIVMIIVMLGTALIFTPDGTPLRSEVRSAAFPYFSQSWRVFAPNILKSNRTLEIRAQWRDDDGELFRSGWVSITDIEQRTVTGNLASSRILKNSWNASSTYIKRYNKLDEDQRQRVRDTFIERAGDDFQPIPVEDLIDELGTDDSDVIRFLRVDYMLMRYATLYATAGFGQEIERVQWRVVNDRPNDFTHRFDDEQQFTSSVRTFGWRQSNVGISQTVVDDYRAVIERYGGLSQFERAATDGSE